MFSSGQMYHYYLHLLIMMGLNLSPIQIVEIGRDKRRYHLKKASVRNHRFTSSLFLNYRNYLFPFC